MNYKKIISETLSKYLTIESSILEKYIEIPSNLNLGDYSFPCFVLKDFLKKSPNKLALEIVNSLSNIEGFEKIEAIGPYINFYMDKKYYTKTLVEIILKEKYNYGNSAEGKGKTIVVEYGTLNTFNNIEATHICYMMLGESMSKIYESQGYNVIRINNGGDKLKSLSNLFNVKFAHNINESFSEYKSIEIYKELISKKLCVESNGFTIVELEKENLPPFIVNKLNPIHKSGVDELSYIFYMKSTYDFYKYIFVRDRDESLHLNQLFSVISRMGYEFQTELIHLPTSFTRLQEENVLYIQSIYYQGTNILKQIGTINCDIDYLKLISDEEYRLIKKLGDFNHIIKLAELNNQPQIVLEYIISIAGSLNNLYYTMELDKADNKLTIIKKATIIKAALQVMKNAMNLICLEVISE